MTKDQQARRIAALMEREYERRMAAIRATGREPTTLEKLFDIYDIGNAQLRKATR